MRYTPHTDAERGRILAAIGVSDIDELFADIPDRARFPKIDLPDGLSELEIRRLFAEMAGENATVDDQPCFLGAGAYFHFIPALIRHLLFRSEVYTAYTPYQPEISQGTLQGIFEFQTLVCRLFGMDVANASMYDGSTALAEAGLMAVRLTRSRRTRLLVSEAMHPEYRDVLATYTRGTNLEIVAVPFDPATGTTRPEDVTRMADGNTAGLLVQYPNFFGQIEPLALLGRAIHDAGGHFVVGADPVAVGLLRPPGEFQTDIVVAEGQPLGIPLYYGGPYVGLFATRQDHVRQMPGRLVGETVDLNGDRAFVLTLKPREQDIRREKATSNICTNEALIATAVTIYLSAMGKHGFRQVSEHCYHNAHYLAQRLCTTPGVEMAFGGNFFREFAVRTPVAGAELNRKLWEDHGIIGGFALEQRYPELKGHLLLTATEMNSRADIDRMVDAVGRIVR